MNRRRIIFFTSAILLIILAILMLRTCKPGTRTSMVELNPSPDQSFELIPEKATFIFTFDLNRVLTELDFDSLRNTEKYIQRLTPSYQQNPPFTQVFANPKGCGVNTNKKAIFYVDVGSTPDETYSATILSLQNVQFFKGMTEKELKGSAEKRKNHSQMKIDERSLVAWNDNFAVFLTSNESFDASNVLADLFDPFVKKYYSEQENFLKWAQRSEADASFWFDMDAYSKNQIFPINQDRELMDVKYLEDIVYMGDVNFDKGKISIALTAKWNELIGSFIDKVIEVKADKDILNDIPQRDISFASTFSLNIEKLLGLVLNDVKSKIKARNSLREYGLVIEDFKDVFTGDFAFLSFPNNYTHKSSTLIVATIKNKKQLDFLLKTAERLNSLVKEGDDQYVMPRENIPVFPIEVNYDDSKLRLLVDEGYLYLSGDKSLIDFIKENDAENQEVNRQFIDINNSSNALVSAYMSGLNKSISGMQQQFSIKSFNLNYTDDIININIETNDSTRSSLKQILAID